MNNFRGELVNEATPSMPVEIIGLTGVSEAGDDFLVLESESKAKEINEYRIEQGKSKKTSALVKKNDVFGDVNKQISQIGKWETLIWGTVQGHGGGGHAINFNDEWTK